MRVSAKADYAVRAAAELAAAREEAPVKGERLAEAQDIPLQFLEHILLELKHHGIVRARRGAKGGYWLARPADEVTVAEIVRAVEGPIAHVQSTPPEDIEYRGNAEHLQEVWIAVRASLRTVLEEVTLADLVSGELPERRRRAHRRARRLGRAVAALQARLGHDNDAILGLDVHVDLDRGHRPPSGSGRSRATAPARRFN